MIEKLNNAIVGALQGLRVSALGVAEPIIVIDSDELELPKIVLPDGECLPILDDEDDVCFYHKINKKTYQRATNKGYGDKPSIQATYDMSLVVYGFRSKISAIEAEKRITAAIAPMCEVGTVEFNRSTVFYSEFSGIQFFLQPNVFLFRVNYTQKKLLTNCDY